jgi:hypothetical protein
VAQQWPALPYDGWSATCDTLHAHAQVLGKLAVGLAPPEPQLFHAALRLTGRGLETTLLPAPDGSGALVVTLDLRAHEAVVEHTDGRFHRVPLAPDRPVGQVTKEVLGAVEGLVGRVPFNPQPQEVPWTVPLDEDEEHHTYDPDSVATYFSAATHAALVLAELRAPYRGRSSQVNAWWGSFDLAIDLFSGEPADPPSTGFITRNSVNAQLIAIGWWPGDRRYPHPAFFGYAFPAPDGFAKAELAPPAARFSDELGEYILDWDDVIASPDPGGMAMDFGRSLIAHACRVCGWDPALSQSAQGRPPPVE